MRTDQPGRPGSLSIHLEVSRSLGGTASLPWPLVLVGLCIRVLGPLRANESSEVPRHKHGHKTAPPGAS